MQERLQKILAHAGVASRRRAEELIEQGRVSVNGEVIRRMGVRADAATDVIVIDGKRLRPPEPPVYILLNKPRNVVSTRSDPEGRPTVLDLVSPRIRQRLYPVGRLDFASEGLLVLTNDGTFTRFMTRAGGVPKTYRVKVAGRIEEDALERLRRGLRLDGVRTAPCEITTISSSAHTWLEVTLKQGRNRQVRRMFEAIGHKVLKLRRTRIGFLEEPALEPGASRPLRSSEVDRFYALYGDGPPPAPQQSRHRAGGSPGRAGARRKRSPA